MKTSAFPWYSPPFEEYNVAQAAAVPFLDKDVNMVVSFQTAVGKCMEGVVRVCLADGSYDTLENLFTSGGSHQVLSLNQRTLKFESSDAEVVCRSHSGRMVDVVTDGGSRMGVTPEHPYLVKRSSCLEWIEAAHLEKGDFIVVPRIVGVRGREIRPDVVELLGRMTSGYVRHGVLVRTMVVRFHGRRYGAYQAMAEALGVKSCVVRNWVNNVAMPLPMLVKMARMTRVARRCLHGLKIKGSNSGGSFVVPSRYGLDWARFVGMMIADGRVKGGRVQLFNYDGCLRDEFARCVRNCFGRSVTGIVDARAGRVVGVGICSRPFVEMILGWGFVDGKKSNTIRVPGVVFRGGRNVIGSLLGGMIDCDGSVYEHCVEYSTDSEGLAFDVKSLLLRLGVGSIVRRRFFRGRMRYRVLVYGASEARKLLKFVHLVSDEKMNRLRRMAMGGGQHSNRDVVPFVEGDVRSIKGQVGLCLRELGPFVQGVLYGGRNPSVRSLGGFLDLAGVRYCGSESARRLRVLCESEIRFDRVVSAKSRDFSGNVYDMVVPGNRSFIGENVVAHNTVLAECAFAYHLKTDEECKVAYVCPFRSLASEKGEEWKAGEFGGFGMVMGTGDSSAGPEEFEKARLAVVTNESFDSKTRLERWLPWIKSLRCVVFDEAHLLSDGGRGGALESSMMRLSALNPEARMILLSATMSNAMEVARWVKSLNGKPTKCVTSSWRPTRTVVEVEAADGCEGKVERAVLKALASADKKVVVFVHSKVTGADITKRLKKLGVRAAFHNASLAPARRRKLEAAFNDQYSGLNVIVATSTLSSGVNIG